MNQFDSGNIKLKFFTDEIQSWIAGRPFVPVTLEIQPTERCNHNCPFCQAKLAMGTKEAHHRANFGANLDFGLLDTVWDMPPKGIVISGNTGDPLLHPEAEFLLGKIAAKRIPCVLITNGQSVTPSIADAAADACTGIRVSLDAYDEASFRRTHGSRASWHKVLSGITELRRATASQEDLSFGVGYLTDNQTTSGMMAATRIAISMELDYIQFRPFHGRISNIFSEFHDCCQLAQGSRTQVLASNQKYYRSLQRNYNLCYGHEFYAVLDARADFYVCCHHVGQLAARTGSLRYSTWHEWITSQERASVASCFPNPTCVPGCRLHSHNNFLHSQKLTTPSVTVPISDKVLLHSPFL